MSHFTVLVVTKTGSPEEVETELAPFHEFECTGRNDEYVLDIDKTAEYRAEYEAATDKVMVNDLTGERVGYWDDRWYTERDHRGERERKPSPLEWSELEVPTKEAIPFFQYIIDNYGGNTTVDLEPDTDHDDFQYGYVVVDAAGEVLKAVRRTNPNAEWDWYVIGGRWEGMLRKIGAGSQVNTLRKNQLDIAGMERDAIEGATAKWNFIRDNIIKGESWLTFEECDQDRERYWDQSVMKRFSEARTKQQVGFFLSLDDYRGTLESFVEKTRLSSFSAFAVLQDGEWMQRGDMGWWGCVSGEKADWNEQFRTIFDKIPDDAYITVVDCHI